MQAVAHQARLPGKKAVWYQRLRKSVLAWYQCARKQCVPTATVRARVAVTLSRARRRALSGAGVANHVCAHDGFCI
jgi:hypothetical protein